jgi:predicted MFS family arabinose efflux permease
MRVDPRRIAVSLAGFCAFLDLYAPQSVLPLLAREFDAGAADISLIISASTLAVALTAPFIGAIADVLGRKRVITVAMFALVAPTLLIALTPSLHGMVFWRFIQGLLLPPIFTVIVAYIGEEWPPAEATAVAGIYLSASSFGGFFGRFVTGVLADYTGWRAAFLLLAALTLACAVGVLVFLPREGRFLRSDGIVTSLRQMLLHLGNRQLVAIYAVGFGVLFTFIATFTYVNFYLAGPPYNLSAAALGFIFVVYLTGVITTPLTGRVVARFGRRRLILCLLLLWAAGLALTLLPSLPAIIAGLAVSAGCGFMCQAIATSFVAITAKAGRSSAVGLYATWYYVGGSVGGLLPGIAWNIAGWPGCIALVWVALAIIALTVHGSWKERLPPS